MKKGRILLFLNWLILVSLLFVGFSIEAQAKGGREPNRDRKSAEWITEEWSGDESPYRNTRSSIDTMVQAGKEPADLMKKYRAEAKNWRDPLAQFRWVYPAYLSQKKQGFPERSRIMYDAKVSLDLASQGETPTNYEYARLRFLVETSDTPVSQLAPVGERLVKRNPKDYEVRFRWARCMAMSPLYSGTSARMDNAKILVQAFPDSPDAQNLLAAVYLNQAARKKYQEPESVNRAINAYQKAQKLSKPGSQEYKSAQNSIDLIKRMRKWYADRANN